MVAYTLDTLFASDIDSATLFYSEGCGPIRLVALSAQMRRLVRLGPIRVAKACVEVRPMAPTKEFFEEGRQLQHIEVAGVGDFADSERSGDTFVNPFTGRLTPAWGRVAKELFSLGFEHSIVNPFRLVWNPTKAALVSDAALQPFRTSTVTWRRNLAALLSRRDAADAVGEEIHRLYNEITSAYLPPKLDTMHDPRLSTMTMTPDQQNVIRCALRGYSMFIGGSAGTGKTVLLKAIHRKLTEMGLRVAMTATTGVASVQLGGCTFHLAFGVPIKGEEGTRKRWDSNAFRAVDVVIIDEVSLLDAELFETFEEEARMARLQQSPFGGLQVIACGDFLQLAMMDVSIGGPCYQSHAFRHLIPVCLVTSMRQAQGDPFCELLGQLRVGKFDKKAFKALDRPVSGDANNVTYIFPRRCDAQRLNDEKLCELRSEEMIFAPQRGPLQLVGNFTPAGLVDWGRKKDFPKREKIITVLTEEIKRITGVDIVDHNIVVMPAGGEKNAVLIRLRHSEDRNVLICKNGGSKEHGASNEGGAEESHWRAILEATAGRLKGKLHQIYNQDPHNFIPPSVSLMLADASLHPNAELISPLRLKLGCRVMINRNLSRTVSNGSVGIVEAFAAPNLDLFPRRHETLPKAFHTWSLERNGFQRLPIVRLLSGEVVQLPPLSVMIGGTPSTYFYGHELFVLPLQLGYGFTVHKVQGLTLEGTVVLDCKKFFECPHLVYVACSRVRSMDQLIVRNVRSDMIIVRQSALDFTNALRDASVMSSLDPPDGCTRASWVRRLSPLLVGLTD
ncbi:DNA repair and recombination helicase protein PIF1, putative [Trypanosoma brucei gambiense DAL972]|uniref:ATP-dependent DNA helicase n=1 Tax=Trypanosoma brucei gambiense (strain MHOM/CI/86/DAL972) TaxID=679716 RepID=D0A956_TRYB9|nr:DNA repair and recombination helicase protein PIF1, putative [Trypanosoma brucei gambiense DAL972]CBH18207.1 DNA repair and recombination helicase protein PIF1, putative [Trypanosoma brucei gambiense DAL972]|eukprot:XP_011780471.1 DNA repair and recombination helicase protein PIF1, putative [Trypanosoma brucei gambiense DAL972]